MSSRTLEKFLHSHILGSDIEKLVLCIGQISQRVADLLRSVPVDHAGSSNVYGDKQLSVDILADDAIFTGLEESDLVSFAASEEEPDGKRFHDSSTRPFDVYFDPLDGSSIADCNWSVGSIFSVFPSSPTLTGHKGSEQVLAAVVVYGPRTTITFGLKHAKLVFETTLLKNEWIVTTSSISVENEAKIFSPANLRAANDLPGYKRIIDQWIGQRKTLRYTGGMVPDVVGILVKGNGIFASPVSENARAKLRLVFEVAPIALIMELAGGLAIAARPAGEEPVSVLDIPIESVNDRIGVICGSQKDVLDCYRSIYQGV